MSELRHFLIVFDHCSGELVSREEYEDAGEAIVAYARKEREHEGQQDLEIVLIGSDSLETVQRTHANYFNRAVASKYLKDL